MAFPTNWTLIRQASGTRSIRFYQTGTTTAAFSDNAFVFGDQAAASNYTPLPVVAPGSTAQVTVPATPWGGGTGDGNPDPSSAVVGSVPRMLWCRAFLIHNTGANAIEFSFDGTNVHGFVPANTSTMYFDRFEAGIAVRGSGGTPTFIIEAW